LGRKEIKIQKIPQKTTKRMWEIVDFVAYFLYNKQRTNEIQSFSRRKK